MYQREKVSCWLKVILIAMKMIRSSFVLDPSIDDNNKELQSAPYPAPYRH